VREGDRGELFRVEILEEGGRHADRTNGDIIGEQITH
jgi:hypothetical protein